MIIEDMVTFTALVKLPKLISLQYKGSYGWQKEVKWHFMHVNNLCKLDLSKNYVFFYVPMFACITMYGTIKRHFTVYYGMFHKRHVNTHTKGIITILLPVCNYTIIPYM